MTTAAPGTTYVTSVTDALFDGRRCLILAGNTVMLLSELATCVVATATTAVSIDHITRECVNTLGLPESDPHEAVEAVVRALVDAHVLVEHCR